MAFTSYFTTSGPTVYGKTEDNKLVAFQSAEQLAQAQGSTSANFNLVQQRPDYNTTGAILYPDYLKPATSSIPVNQLNQPQTSVNMTQTLPQPGPDQSRATVAGAQQTAKTLEQIQKELVPPETAESKTYKSIVDSFSELSAQTANKANDQLAAEQAQNLPQLNKQLAEINSQILTRSAEYEKLYTEQEGEVMTMSSIVGRQAQIKKAAASEIGLLQARGLGLSGQVEAAQATADRAIDLKYSAIEDQINIKMKQVELILPLLNQQEARQAQALQIFYNQEQARAEQQKADQKYAFTLALEYGVTAPYFENGGVIYNTRTLEPVYENVGGEIRRLADGFAFSSQDQFFADAKITSWSQLQNIEQLRSQRMGQDSVSQLMSQYPDAGITLQDDLATAQSKIQGSRIYREQTRPPVTGGGASGLSPTQVLNLQNQVEDNFRQDPNVKIFSDVRGAYEQARQAYEQNNTAGDIVLMRTIAKITDPSSAVREEEFATFQGAVGTLPRYGVQMTSNLIGKGQLTQSGRNSLMTQVQNIYQQREAAYLNSVYHYQSQIEPFGGSLPTYVAPQDLEPLALSPEAQQQEQGFWSSITKFFTGK